ncbi:hypothetical protein BVI2075_120091 [Burkholderia vietnamiensis]|nr:hypothetical protein BVI2075_120091 [Burkholderia vietnamiensis]
MSAWTHARPCCARPARHSCSGRRTRDERRRHAKPEDRFPAGLFDPARAVSPFQYRLPARRHCAVARIRLECGACRCAKRQLRRHDVLRDLRLSDHDERDAALVRTRPRRYRNVLRAAHRPHRPLPVAVVGHRQRAGAGRHRDLSESLAGRHAGFVLAGESRVVDVLDERAGRLPRLDQLCARRVVVAFGRGSVLSVVPAAVRRASPGGAARGVLAVVHRRRPRLSFLPPRRRGRLSLCVSRLLRCHRHRLLRGIARTQSQMARPRADHVHGVDGRGHGARLPVLADRAKQRARRDRHCLRHGGSVAVRELRSRHVAAARARVRAHRSARQAQLRALSVPPYRARLAENHLSAVARHGRREIGASRRLSAPFRRPGRRHRAQLRRAVEPHRPEVADAETCQSASERFAPNRRDVEPPRSGFARAARMSRRGVRKFAGLPRAARHRVPRLR